MKISLINGCVGKRQLELYTIDKICKTLKDKDLNYELINLDDYNLKNCAGCDSCQNKNPGICCINDGINEILKQFLNSEVSIIATPIKFGSYNSLTKNFIDRTEPLFLPYQRNKNGGTMMEPRYKNYPSIIYVGIMEDEDSESKENFKETVLKSNLSGASDKVRVEVITEKSKIFNLNFV